MILRYIFVILMEMIRVVEKLILESVSISLKWTIEAVL
ncbi:hypothetical protein LEP1GSC062_2830 [Leptospira alexanderi serovar Manhao 3 str. L 60]|uniref:Uncharacterized protein n=1 Tax=Leptospira alexanderi serovar Manhao 3 str. L 60 TaxID=1049759 RepID=V6HYU2_9LEPT|nr:hypothetical protein LEP1GSC062_2830 [Leptospira alexanderi serovar Manhao 3 str. L 60]